MFRVGINGFICDKETIDNALEMDGKGDEIAFTWSVVSSSSNTGGHSVVFGDINGHPERIQAGSRSPKGGIKTNDFAPTRIDGTVPGPLGFPLPNVLPAWSSVPAPPFPLILWEGELSAGETIVVLPLIWEMDGDFSNPGPGIELANAVATIVATALGFAEIAAIVGKAVSDLASSIGIAGNRPIGMDIAHPDPTKNDWPRLQLSSANINQLLNHDEGFGKGVFQMVQTDPPAIGAGSYRFFLHVSSI